MAIRVKNWAKFQHFKDRRPPWIKLYRDLLDDLDWYQLDIKLVRHLVNIWLIASEDGNREGVLPDNRKLAFRLRVSIPELEKTILPGLSGWLVFDDINVISPRYQDGPPETETETETEKDILSSSTPLDTVDEILSYLNAQTGKAFRKSKTTTKLIKTRIREYFTVNDFKKVIDNQTAKWKSDPKMCDYLRPQTLFGTKFESYLNAPPMTTNPQPTSLPPRKSIMCNFDGCKRKGTVGPSGGPYYCREHDPDSKGDQIIQGVVFPTFGGGTTQ